MLVRLKSSAGANTGIHADRNSMKPKLTRGSAVFPNDTARTTEAFF